MANTELSISIPLDEDGYLELECDFCKTRFMIAGEDYENKDMPFFFCPVCGLPNDLGTFYCPEILEKAQQLAAEWAMKEIDRAFGKTIRDINRSGIVKMSMQMPKREPDKELYKPFDDYARHKTECCQMNVKVREIDEQIGIYCPICGGSEI